MSPNYFRDKRVLVMGLGLLGGGVATTKWLVGHGARVTVTDLKSRKELAHSIRVLGLKARKIRFVLGKHRAEDFRTHEVIVVNPGVPRESKYLRIAKKSGARLENEASIFFRFCKNPIIGVTGTRGKTTTVNWLHHILKNKFRNAVLTGNSSDNPMLGALGKLDDKTPVVVELSSWHLELLPQSGRAPHVAVITNIYPDHLNRYLSMRSYVSAKANIFKNQNKNDFLLLKKGDPWTKFFLKTRPRAKVLYFSKKLKLPRDFKNRCGFHNVENLMAAVTAARTVGVSESIIQKAARTLPSVPYREEVIVEKKGLVVVNDTTSTIPEAAIAAIDRFRRTGTIVLIAGGTDKKLNFSGWARVVKRHVKPENLFLLNGSATNKMVRELRKLGYFSRSEPQLFEELPELLKEVLDSLGSFGWDSDYSGRVILFSPGAASFEKFQNEFDRGEQFNLYSKKIFDVKIT